LRAETDQMRLDRLMEILPDTAHLMGWSLGGMLAVSLASRYPQRVRSLTLIATGAVFLRTGGWKSGMAPVAFERFRQSFVSNPERTWRRFIGLHFQGMENARVLTRQMIRLSRGGDIDHGTLLAGLEWLARADVRTAVASLNVPTVALQGERDAITPPSAIDAMGLLNHRIERVVLNGSGHAPFIDRPGKVLPWLRQLASEGNGSLGLQDHQPVRMR